MWSKRFLSKQLYLFTERVLRRVSSISLTHWYTLIAVKYLLIEVTLIVIYHQIHYSYFLESSHYLASEVCNTLGSLFFLNM